MYTSRAYGMYTWCINGTCVLGWYVAHVNMCTHIKCIHCAFNAVFDCLCILYRKYKKKSCSAVTLFFMEYVYYLWIFSSREDFRKHWSSWHRQCSRLVSLLTLFLVHKKHKWYSVLNLYWNFDYHDMPQILCMV